MSSVSPAFERCSSLRLIVGVYVFGPVWGRIADAKGTRIPLIGAFISLLVGYMGIKRMYDDGIGSGASISPVHFAILVLCALLTGFGAIGGLSSTLSTTARSFPQSLVRSLFMLPERRRRLPLFGKSMSTKVDLIPCLHSMLQRQHSFSQVLGSQRSFSRPFRILSSQAIRRLY